MKQEMGLKTHTLRRRLKLPHLAKTNKNVHKSGIFFLYFEIIAAKKSIKYFQNAVGVEKYLQIIFV